MIYKNEYANRVILHPTDYRDHMKESARHGLAKLLVKLFPLNRDMRLLYKEKTHFEKSPFDCEIFTTSVLIETPTPLRKE